MLWNNIDKEKLEERDVNDFYATNIKDVRNALKKVNNDKVTNVLDLCCGFGIWGATYKSEFNKSCHLIGCDIQNLKTDTTLFNITYNDFDILQYATRYNLGGFDLIVSNPPYKYAEEAVKIGYDLLNENGQMIMLLRLSFLESQRRKSFFKIYKPTDVWVMSERPKFDFLKDGVLVTNNKTYPMAYAIYKWEKNYTGFTELGWL